jgi:hypothetical protein
LAVEVARESGAPMGKVLGHTAEKASLPDVLALTAQIPIPGQTIELVELAATIAKRRVEGIHRPALR